MRRGAGTTAQGPDLGDVDEKDGGIRTSLVAELQSPPTTPRPGGTVDSVDHPTANKCLPDAAGIYKHWID